MFRDMMEDNDDFLAIDLGYDFVGHPSGYTLWYGRKQNHGLVDGLEGIVANDH